MVRDNHDDPFDNIFDKIERIMSDMTGGDAGFASGTHIDMYDEGSTFRFATDLPGIDKDVIDLKCGDETLIINAAGDRREYGERIHLPAHVDEHSASATFNNGVLQVTFDCVENPAAIDVE